MSGSSFSTERGGCARQVAARRVPGWVGWLALAAFGLRALVPLGFEPGPHGLSIVLCHEGFPAGYFAHSARRGARGTGSSAASHCPFCNSTSPAPAYALTSLVQRTPYCIGRVIVEPPTPAIIRFTFIPQARAPPAIV